MTKPSDAPDIAVGDDTEPPTGKRCKACSDPIDTGKLCRFCGEFLA